MGMDDQLMDSRESPLWTNNLINTSFIFWLS